ncbi:MAG: hypothetical protein H0X66_05545 [Verrucomicrobia bacterium]|nr:hypothetical protein [Verrucomicrobiota bacterium]
MTSPVSKLLLMALCLVLCGCATQRTYTQKGVPLDPSASAIIMCDSENTHKFLNGLNKKVFIARIDGKSTFTVKGALTDTDPYAEAAYVSPGRHYLDLKYSHYNSYAWGRVWFDAEAGGSYIVRRRISGYSVIFWVEDMETGKVVGGIPGGEPPLGDRPKAPTRL